MDEAVKETKSALEPSQINPTELDIQDDDAPQKKSSARRLKEEKKKEEANDELSDELSEPDSPESPLITRNKVSLIRVP